ncbi:MAG: ATP synthase F0 subunit B [Bacillota bacterium]|jgi:F-type H+-transporting ATPase subunit b|nr:ATP synthase F0 subunit B [Bacillota bacterium]NLL59236.1 ATP synthase F0 subunit B [Tissierellia bacterium]
MQVVPDGRVFGLDAQTLISIGIQLFNAIILALALGFILYNPVKDFLRKRSEKIQKQIDDSDAAMMKAKELIAEYEAKIKDIDKERLEILEAARLKASEESKKILQEAKAEAEAIKERSMESVTADKKRLKDETRIYIIELASLMAQKIITQNINDDTHDKIFEESLAKLEASKWQS